jgi:hypothetical protein
LQEIEDLTSPFSARVTLPAAGNAKHWSPAPKGGEVRDESARLASFSGSDAASPLLVIFARYDIMLIMTELLRQAIATALRLDPAAQDAIARTILMLAGDEEAATVTLTPEDEAAIALSRAQSRRGEFATDEQVAAVWAKHGL